MQNRNLAALRAQLAPEAQAYSKVVAPGILNPDNIPQINAPTIQQRLQNQGYQTFGQPPSSGNYDWLGNLGQLGALVPQQQEDQFPQGPQGQQQVPLGAQQFQGALGQDLAMPSAFPNMPDPVAARQAVAAQGGLPPELAAPQAAQQPVAQQQAPQQEAPAGQHFWEKPGFAQGLQAFGAAFTDKASRPGVSFGRALQQHFGEAQKAMAAQQAQEGNKQLASYIKDNPNAPVEQVYRHMLQSRNPDLMVKGAAGLAAMQKLTQQTPAYEQSERRLKLQRFMALPVNERANYFAYGRALGLDPNKALDVYGSGQSLKDYAIDHGVPKEVANNINPAYPPTNAELTDIQRSLGASAAVDRLSAFNKEARAPYVTTAGGWSKKVISDARSEDPEKVDSIARLLASQSLQIENAAAMFKSLGGNVSEASIEGYLKRTPQINIPNLVLRPEHYRKAADYILSEGQQAAKSSRDAVLHQKTVKDAAKPVKWNVVNGVLVKE